jgi:hypothetical protein
MKSKALHTLVYYIVRILLDLDSSSNVYAV